MRTGNIIRIATRCTLSLLLLLFLTGAYSRAAVLNDHNKNNYNIPDNGASVNSDLLLQGAPAGAVITNVKIYYEIRHTFPGDLDVWLTAYYNGAWHDHFLYRKGDLGGTDNIIEARDNITTFNGVSPNQTFYLVARDREAGDVGFIDFFELWVTYSSNEPPTSPSNEVPANGARGVSINQDLTWSSSDPNGDTIYYTVFFERNDSSPDPVIKQDETGRFADPGVLDYSSHYYWQVKADDHKGGVTWGPVWDFYTEAAPVIPVIRGLITAVTFDKNTVERGNQTITATVTMKNTGNQVWTFHVAGSSIKSGDTKWYDWTPSRASIALSPDQSGNVQLIWSPPADAPVGSYGFFSKAFKNSAGDDFVDDDWREAAFSVSDAAVAPLSISGRLAYHSYSRYLAVPNSGDTVDGNIFLHTFAATATLRNVTQGLPAVNCMNPHISVDGSKIVFMAVPSDRASQIDYDSGGNYWHRRGANLEIFVYDLAEGILTRLTTNNVPDEDPKFSPGGEKIVFKRERQIWTMNTDGSNTSQLTSTGREKSGPIYSPDGTRIVFWYDSRSSADIGWMTATVPNSDAVLFGEANVQEMYPIFRDANTILYSRWERADSNPEVPNPSDDIYAYSISSGTRSKVGNMRFNLANTEDADAFPVQSAYIGFSSTRGGPDRGYDIYVGNPALDIVHPVTGINSRHQDLGGWYSPYLQARKLVLLSPSNDAQFRGAASTVLRARAFSNGGPWTGASPKIVLQGPVNLEFTGLHDDGINGDQTAGDGIYSKAVTLPVQNGVYNAYASAVSRDNSTDNEIRSARLRLTIQDVGNSPPSISPIPDQTIPMDTVATGSFVVGDAETPVGSLIVTGSSVDQTLVRNTNIIFSGAGANRKFAIVPEPKRSGSTRISVTVTDSSGSATTVSFELRVLQSRQGKPERGDFNNDGGPDILFRDASGSLAVWYMNGVNRVGGSLLTPSSAGDTNWVAFDADAFNGDQSADLGFQRTDGLLAVWLMNGLRTNIVTYFNPRSPDRNWRVATGADLNADGKADLLFQHTDSRMVVWYMDGTNQVSWDWISEQPLTDRNWRVVGTGDFNQDTWNDLVFQHSNGSLAVWSMKRNFSLGGALFDSQPSGDARLRVVSTVDRNEDGKPDLLFQHSATLDLVLWVMGGTRMQSWQYLNPKNPGGTWRVVGPK